MTAFYLRGTIFNVLHRKVPGTYAQRLFSGYQQTFSGELVLRDSVIDGPHR